MSVPSLDKSVDIPNEVPYDCSVLWKEITVYLDLSFRWRINVEITLTVVVLPAPFGPRRPNSSPFFTSKEIPSSASLLLNVYRVALL